MANATGEQGLSPDQLRRFHDNGFVGPFTVYEPNEMESRWRSIRTSALDRTHAAYPSDAVSAGTNISNYDRHLDIDLLSEHILRPQIVEKVASILGPDVLCWRTEFFPKHKGDAGTDWHQADTFANASGRPQILWPGETNESFGRGTLTAWTAFTDATLVNGCLQIIPGTHKQMNYDETKRMDYDPDRNSRVEKAGIARDFFGYDYRQLQIDPDWHPDERAAVPLVMQRGQCVIFWSTLMHSSLPHTGTPKDARMGFATRYIPTSVRVYPDTDIVEEYGGRIPLDNYGTVVVCGDDQWGHNRRVTRNRRGYEFKPVASTPRDRR